MPFNSPLFLFVFAPLVIGLNFFLPSQIRNLYLLLGSIVFYAWGEPKFVFVVLAAALIDYICAALMERTLSIRIRGWLLACGVISNLGLLVYCKYLGFFVDTLQKVLGSLGLPKPELILPLGISFIVFEKITYLVDVYRRTTAPARRLTDYLLFVFLFPKLLAGPILKYHEMRDQIEHHSITGEDIEAGAFRFAMGLAKKVLIADSIALISDSIFSAPASQIGFAYSWLGAVSFAVQIYFDFSAYSDMAIGLAWMMGFHLRENFNQPYLSFGFGDFWRRWHISLSSWIRDYLYIPLGGNRVSPVRISINLWICFLASGLWHGANWTFVIWGAYHGVFVAADHAGLSAYLRRFLPRPVGIAATAILVTLGWVLFRANTLDQAMTLLSNMAMPGKSTAIRIMLENDSLIMLGIGLLLSFTPGAWARSIADRCAKTAWPILAQASILSLSAWSFGRVFVSTFKPFIYFRF